MKKIDLVDFSDIFKNVLDDALKNKIAQNKLLGRVGYIETVADGVVRARGMADAAFGEMVYFPSVFGLNGFVCNLNKDSVDILIFGDDKLVKAGFYVVGKGTGLKVPVTKKLLGRIVDSLGNIIDGGPAITDISHYANVNIKAPGIITRKKVSEPVFTGIKIIDSFVNILFFKPHR